MAARRLGELRAKLSPRSSYAVCAALSLALAFFSALLAFQSFTFLAYGGVTGAWRLVSAWSALPLAELLGRIHGSELPVAGAARSYAWKLALLPVAFLAYLLLRSVAPGARRPGDVARSLEESLRGGEAVTLLLVLLAWAAAGSAWAPLVAMSFRSGFEVGYAAVTSVLVLGSATSWLLAGGLSCPISVTTSLLLAGASTAVMGFSACLCILEAGRVLEGRRALLASATAGCMVFAAGLAALALLLALLSIAARSKRAWLHAGGAVSSAALYLVLALAPTAKALVALSIPILAYLAIYSFWGANRFSKEKLGVSILGFITGAEHASTAQKLA